ncbi:cell surface glycoprotein 1-like [Melospiza georgiana]|uniref:cell surface glycoprotein 1-like n=1 Tax=Melospiza georgiana TaxID=44398 RepID=UPI0025AC0223|nr:cell surface glycoprotein 1-like [Melospiza georgiana]
MVTPPPHWERPTPAQHSHPSGETDPSSPWPPFRRDRPQLTMATLQESPTPAQHRHPSGETDPSSAQPPFRRDRPQLSTATLQERPTPAHHGHPSGETDPSSAQAPFRRDRPQLTMATLQERPTPAQHGHPSGETDPSSPWPPFRRDRPQLTMATLQERLTPAHHGHPSGETDPSSPWPPFRRDRPQLSTANLQEVVESDEVAPESPFLQAEQPQLPQSLFTWLVFQAPHQPRCPPLDTLKHLNVPPKLRAQNWMQYSRCALTSAEYRGRMTSLLLLATPFLILARMALALLATWAHCWLTFNRLSPAPPGPFPPEHCPATPSPACIGAEIPHQGKIPAWKGGGASGIARVGESLGMPKGSVGERNCCSWNPSGSFWNSGIKVLGLCFAPWESGNAQDPIFPIKF